MNTRFARRAGVSLFCSGVLILASCGGGGGGSGGGGVGLPIAASPPVSAAPVSAPASGAATPTTDVKVVDGAIRNALVFLDKNNNGRHDEGEPSARSDASGQAKLDIPPEGAGKAPIVALVGTDSIDADTGPVPVAFSLSAPADRSGVVSPLTTLVHRIVLDSGVSADNAEAGARSQIGLGSSLFGDFTVDSSSAGRAAAVTARLLVLVMQQQAGQLAALQGRADLSGATITAGDITTAIHRSLLDAMASVGAAARSTAVQSACAGGPGTPDCEAALRAQSSQIVAASGLTAESAPTLIGAGRTPDAAAQAPAPSASLSFMGFGYEGLWYYGGFIATAQENTPDAAGLIRYRGLQRSKVVDTLFEMGPYGDTHSIATAPQLLHWNGSAWVQCTASTQSVESQRDANGRAAYSNYCDGLMSGSSQRSVLDVSGRKMSEVVASISTRMPSSPMWGGNQFGIFAGMAGPNYGTAVMPAGSKLQVQTNVMSATAPAVYSTIGMVGRYSAAIAAGGDTRDGSSPACASDEAKSTPTIVVSTLEELLTYFRGTPCIYSQDSVVSPGGVTLYGPSVEERWLNSTWIIAIEGNEGTASGNETSYYNNNILFTASFPAGGGNAVTYYRCRQRQGAFSINNCTPIGSGTYVIETLGDARLLRLKNLPPQTAGFNSERVYVERGGVVHSGFKYKPFVSRETQLNLTAANAVFSQIGIPAIVP
ncbi:hypothetical protein [Variovorax saccharolyticus]|uniref:hypothetical protein n=1 Tax=Variovorax saccharolyticus TaxID=3053516 RepID=UPI002574CC98|nr:MULTISPECIES: hypothetical protein [unclassified Variovorax]MDM0017145.1 hypothetical protein [Variovorax sp. J22R187]MDM0029321.1 hypothetical protein [Variovorax sp. J31P216]